MRRSSFLSVQTQRFPRERMGKKEKKKKKMVMMIKSRKISTAVGLCIIALLLVLSAVFLYLSSLTATNLILNALLLIVSMALVFFSTHPLAHYIVAGIYGVRVEHFFIAPSDFRKLNQRGAKFFGSKVPTLGTKLDRGTLSGISSEKRARIYGAGAIASSILILVPLIYSATIGRGSPIAILLGILFFAGNLAFELEFSTKVGDLSKMKREYIRSRSC